MFIYFAKSQSKKHARLGFSDIFLPSKRYRLITPIFALHSDIVSMYSRILYISMITFSVINSHSSFKVWNIDALSYVETLYGHQDQIIALDSLHQERALSCGGRDRTVRLWKVRFKQHKILYCVYILLRNFHGSTNKNYNTINEM